MSTRVVGKRLTRELRRRVQTKAPKRRKRRTKTAENLAGDFINGRNIKMVSAKGPYK